MNLVFRTSLVVVAVLSASTAVYAEDFDVRIYRMPYSMLKSLAVLVAEKTNGSVDPTWLRNNLSNNSAAFDTNDWDGTGLVTGETGSGDSIALSLNDGHKVFWGEDETMEYLEARDDGRYDLRAATVEQGLGLALRRTGEQSSELWLHFVQVPKREKIDGISLDVGRPSPTAQPDWDKRAIRTAVGEWSAIAFSRSHDRGLAELETVFVFVRANTPFTGPAAETAVERFSVESKVFTVSGLPKRTFIESATAPIVRGAATIISNLHFDNGRVVDGSEWTTWEALDRKGLDIKVLCAPRATLSLAAESHGVSSGVSTSLRILLSQPVGGTRPEGDAEERKSDAFQQMVDRFKRLDSLLWRYLSETNRSGVSVMMDVTEGSDPSGDYTGIATAQRVLPGLDGGEKTLEYVFTYRQPGTAKDGANSEIGAEVHVPFADRESFLLRIPGYDEIDSELFVLVTVERGVE